jgi:hypothetical protein
MCYADQTQQNTGDCLLNRKTSPPPSDRSEHCSLVVCCLIMANPENLNVDRAMKPRAEGEAITTGQ